MDSKSYFYKTCIAKGAYLLPPEKEYYSLNHDKKSTEETIFYHTLANTLDSFKSKHFNHSLVVHKKLLFNSSHPLIFSKTWVTGGASGGNCYGDDAQEFPGEAEPDVFASFEQWRDVYCKNYDTFTLLKDIPINFFNKSDYEYYGNYTQYETKYFLVDDLFNRICQLEQEKSLNKKMKL